MITLSEYSSDWPDKFDQEKQRLQGIIGRWVEGGIEHIGSTAIPGLVAKPVIDIMAGVRSLEESRPAIELLNQNGYEYWPYKPQVMHWFCRPSDAFRTHHLHLIPFASELWKERLIFRDTLRANQALAEKYAALKKRLAQQFRHDRETYTDMKEPFIRKVLEIAEKL